jgi:hypothetical protein
MKMWVKRPHTRLVIRQTGITSPGDRGVRGLTTPNHQNNLVCYDGQQKYFHFSLARVGIKPHTLKFAVIQQFQLGLGLSVLVILHLEFWSKGCLPL